MSYEDNYAAYMNPAAVLKDVKTSLPYVNQTSQLKAAAVKGAAASAATERMADSVDLLGPAITVTTVDGSPTVFARGTQPSRVGSQVSADELRALTGEDPQKFPPCAVPKCKGEGSYRIYSGSGRPVTVNRHGQVVFGDQNPLVEEGMSRNDRARAKAGLVGVVGPSGVQPAQLEAKAYIDVCLAHQTLPTAPSKPPRRYISGPYDGYGQATNRAHLVSLRTRHEAGIFSQKVNGRDAFYVRGDDGSEGYSGKLVAL